MKYVDFYGILHYFRKQVDHGMRFFTGSQILFLLSIDIKARNWFWIFVKGARGELGFIQHGEIRPIIQIQSSSFPTNVIICWQVTARTGWCLPRDFPCSLDPFSVTWTPSMKSAPRNKKATSSSPTPTMSLCKYFYLKNFEVIPWVLSVSVLEVFSEMPRRGRL